MPDKNDDLVDVASAHFARLHSRAVTDEERQAIDAWRIQDAAHDEALDNVRGTWSMLGFLAETPEIAALRSQALDRNPPCPAAAPERRWLAMAAGLAGLLALPGAYFAFLGQDGPRSSSQQIAAAPAGPALSAPDDQKRQLELPDGSRVLLDAGSTIQMAYRPDRRAVQLLKGRAFFQVRKDKTRPFSVEAGHLTAIAVGTAFDVRKLASGAEVTTTEGLVQVKAKRPGDIEPATAMVPAGMHLSYSGVSIRLTQIDVGQATSWHQGKLVFASRCLTSAASDFNAYAPRKLTVAPDAENLAISGVFEADNVDAFMHTLEEQGVVKIAVLDNVIVLSRGSASNLPLCTG